MSLAWHREGFFFHYLVISHLELYTLNSSQDLKVLFEGVVVIQRYAREKDKGIRAEDINW